MMAADSIEAIRRRRWFFRPTLMPAVRSMLTADELRLLHFLARQHFRDRGNIIDAGCFLGGSTVAFAHGLAGTRPRHRIHSYDLFRAGPFTDGALPSSIRPGDSFRPLFERAIERWRPLIEIHDGDITAGIVPDEPVEILFVDCAKTAAVADFITRAFFPKLIPGVSIVVQQDYLFPAWNAWIHIAMERLSAYFEKLTDTGIDSVVFLNTAPIPPEALAAAQVRTMDAATKLDLMLRARRRFSGYAAGLLRASHVSYLLGPAWYENHDPNGHADVLRQLIREDLPRLPEPSRTADLRAVVAAPAVKVSAIQQAVRDSYPASAALNLSAVRHSRVRNRLELYAWRIRTALSILAGG